MYSRVMTSHGSQRYGAERANQGQVFVSTCTPLFKEEAEYKIIGAAAGVGSCQSQCRPSRRSCSAQDQGSARASAVTVRPAGVVPSRRPETTRGERNASDISSRMCRS